MLEDAALLDAGRVVAADQLDRDRGLDGLVEADADQVDVDRVAADGVALRLLENRGTRRAAVE